jgi:hypothetical protein
MSISQEASLLLSSEVVDAATAASTIINRRRAIQSEANEHLLWTLSMGVHYVVLKKSLNGFSSIGINHSSGSSIGSFSARCRAFILAFAFIQRCNFLCHSPIHDAL